MTYFTTGVQLQAALNALPTTKTGQFVAFDSFFYGQQYLGAYAGTLSPIEHFVQIGADRGYKPNATFDPTYYANAFADLKGKGFNSADLLYHFLKYGLDEGRTPNAELATFNGTAYLAANPDVAAYVNANLAQFGNSVTNGALAHYVKFGAAEGRAAPGTSVSNGQTFTLTASIDNVVGTAGNDTIIGDKTSTNPADQIDGGAGIDTLKLTGFGDTGFTTLPATIKNVENITLVGNLSATVDLSATSGVTNLTLENNSVATAIAGMTSAQTLGLTNVSDNTKAIGATLGATDASASLKLSGSKDAGAVTFTGSKIETVNVNSTGAVANKLASLAVATGSLKNLVITGDKGLTVTAPLADTVAKIDGAASTGGFTLAANALLAVDTTVTGGAGADSITFLAGGTKAVTVALGAGNDKLTLNDATFSFGATSTFAGGEGTDTLVIANAAALTATTGKQFTGFETLDLAGGQGTYDVSFLAAGNTISTIQVGDALAAAATVKNVATGSAVNILASDTFALTVEVKDAATTKTDSLTFNLGGAAAVTSTALTAANVETITLNSTSKLATWDNAVNTNTVASLVTDKATVLNITGDKTLTLTSVTDTVLTKIDASAFTGNFVMGGATTATQILGGTGNDTLIAAAAGSTINAGKGNDKITAGAAKDVLIFNAGDALAVVKAGALDVASLETVTGFATGVDVIDLGSFGFTGTAQSALAVKGAIATLPAADVANFFVDAGVTRGVATGTNGGSTYVFVDADKDGNLDIASDLVIVVGSPVNFADIGF